MPDRPALKRFVRRGGALIGTHSASDTFHSWPAFETMLGGEFVRHGALQPGRLIVRKRDAITRRLPPTFRLTDECYEFAAPVPPGRKVLVRSIRAASRMKQGRNFRSYGRDATAGGECSTTRWVTLLRRGRTR